MKKEIRILVIDDMMFMRDMIVSSLNKIFPKIQSDVATNGKEAQAKMEAIAYDLVLCDWELPDIKGNELLRWARSKEGSPLSTIPFIMVTARSDKEAIMEAKEAGVTDYIIKPLTVDVLGKKVARALSGVQKQE